MQEVIISTDFLGFLRFGVQQELAMNYIYGLHTQRGVSTYKCQYPNCRARFKVRIQDGVYNIFDIHEEHSHTPGLDEGNHTYSSPFYRAYMKDYFSKQRPAAFAQQACFLELCIPTQPLPMIYTQSDEALKKICLRSEPNFSQFRSSSNTFISLHAFILSIQQNSPDDLAFFDNSNGKLIVGYAPFEAKSFAHDNIRSFHIDSTHQMIEGRIPLYALTAKTAQSHVFPFFYFVSKPENHVNIGQCLYNYLTWAFIDPERIYFCADCAKQIYTAIETCFPLSRVIWCAVHVLRAVQRQTSLFDSMENFESFLLLMDQLTLRNNDVQESEQFYEELVEILEGSEPRAFEYFSNTWLKHKEKWMMCYRQDADSTNNISETHFRQLKHFYFVEERNLPIDKLFVKLVTKVTPTFVIKIAVFNNLSERNLRIMSSIPNSSAELKEAHRDELMTLLSQLHEMVSGDWIDIDQLLPTIRAVHKKMLVNMNKKEKQT